MFENHAGINFSETKLQLVELGFKNSSFYLENVDQSIFKESLNPEIEESKLIAVLQESFNKITSRKPLNTKFVSFTLPNEYFHIFEIPYDQSLTRKDLLQHFRWEISVLFPNEDSENFFIQHIEVNKSLIRPEYKAIVFALRKDIVKTIHKFCLSNKLELKFVDNAHLASNAFLYTDNSAERSNIVFSIYIDQYFSSFTAIEGVNPFYFKVFNTGETSVFEEIDSIKQSLSEMKLNSDNAREVILYGQSVTKEFENRLAEKFELPLKKINPFNRLHVDDNMKKNTLYSVQFNSFTAATGIAIRII